MFSTRSLLAISPPPDFSPLCFPLLAICRLYLRFLNCKVARLLCFLDLVARSVIPAPADFEIARLPECVGFDSSFGDIKWPHFGSSSPLACGAALCLLSRNKRFRIVFRFHPHVAEYQQTDPTYLVIPSIFDCPRPSTPILLHIG